MYLNRSERRVKEFIHEEKVEKARIKQLANQADARRSKVKDSTKQGTKGLAYAQDWNEYITTRDQMLFTSLTMMSAPRFPTLGSRVLLRRVRTP